MLRVVEYGLFAVSLLMVLGLIVSGRRNSAEPVATNPSDESADAGAAQTGPPRES